MQASKIVTTASIWTLEGLLESRWNLLAAVMFLSRVVDMTDTDTLCSLAVIKGNQSPTQGVGLYVDELVHPSVLRELQSNLRMNAGQRARKRK